VAVTDTRIATDVTPWWADATDGKYLLSRALCLMWTDVRWRTPAMKTERQLFDEIHKLMSKAYPHDPGLTYPWKAWAELVDLAGIDDSMACRFAIGRAPEMDEGCRSVGWVLRSRSPADADQRGMVGRRPGHHPAAGRRDGG
jgi:hypothetical protein